MAGRGAGPVGGVLLRAAAALVRGDLDLVITSDPQPLDAVDYLPLFKYELVLAVSESNPWPAASSSCRTSWRTRR